MGTTNWLRLLGDAASPGIEEMLAAANEATVITRAVPLPIFQPDPAPDRPKKKKKKGLLIRKDLNSEMTVGEGWVTINGHHVLIDGEDSSKVLWHGTPDSASHSAHGGMHIGSHEAAKQALEARIGIPVKGEWDGTREYGKTLLAGQATLRKNGREMNITGYSSDAPQEDHYPTGKANYSDGTPIPMTAKPEIYPVEIIGKMTNTRLSPHSDTKANALMAGQIKKGTAKSGYYYKNEGEDVGSISAVVPNANHLKRLPVKKATNEAVVFLSEAAVGGGRWITVNGNHIFIGADVEHPVLFGAAIYRSSHNVDNIAKVKDVFTEKPALEFEKSIPEKAKSYKELQLEKVERAVGVWQKSREASFLLEGTTTDDLSADAFAAHLGETAPERQMAMVRFSADPKGKGAAYEFDGVPEKERSINILMKHGFDGQTLPLGTGRMTLFDTDGSMHANVIAAAKELGVNFTTTPGNVRFIDENEYRPIQEQYRKAHGQPATEIYNRYAAALQEAQRANQALTEILSEAAAEGDGHWVTIHGNPVFIGGVSDASIPKDMEKMAAHLPIADKSIGKAVLASWGENNSMPADWQAASTYFDRLNQSQLVIAHAELQKHAQTSGFEKNVLPTLVSRLDDAHAEQVLAQSVGQYKTDTENAMAWYGPGKVAEGIIAANPDKYPVFSKDPIIAHDALVNSALSGQSWDYGPQIRVEYAAENIGPNKGNTGLINYWGEARGIHQASPLAALDNTMQEAYNRTQQRYAEQNIKEVTVYRGARNEFVTHKPLETWTTDAEEATKIAGPHGFLLTATVPVTAIFSSAVTESHYREPSIFKDTVTVLGGGIKDMKSQFAPANLIKDPAERKAFIRSGEPESDFDIEFRSVVAGTYEVINRGTGELFEGWVTINGHHVLIGQQADFPFYSQMKKDREAQNAEIRAREDKREAERQAKISASAKESEAHLLNAKVSSSDELGGGTSETMKVEFEDGTAGVFKPGDGARGGLREVDITDGYQTEREVAAWEVAKLVGVDDLVTPTVKTEIDGREGALLAWRDGEVAANLRREDMYDGEKDLQRAAAFDFVIGNEDRHGQNWLVENGKLQLIDHGLSFPDKGDKDEGVNRNFLSYINSEFPDSKIPEEIKQSYVGAKQDILNYLSGSGLPGGSGEGVYKRIDALAQAKTWQDVTGVYFEREWQHGGPPSSITGIATRNPKPTSKSPDFNSSTPPGSGN